MNPKEHFISYLKERNIYYKEDVYEGTSRITMSFSGYLNSPSKRIEACVYFYKASRAIEARVYYAEPGPQIVKEKHERLPALFRVLNFLNACAYVKNMDGAGDKIYSPSYLLQPRYYMTEDECYNITASVVMDEDCFWVAPLEIEDFLTVALPSLMEELSLYVYGILMGNIDVELAIQYIREKVLLEEVG